MRVIVMFSLAGAAACTDASPTTHANAAAATVAAVPASPTLCTLADGGLPYSKYKHAFFGNLHQHTSYSLDANGFGTRNTPAEAYAFAKTETSLPIAEAYLGHTDEVTLDRALDFLAITDHSEWLGVSQEIAACKDPNNKSAQCTTLRASEKSAWLDEQQAAKDAYEPCKFTSLIAYEWTSIPDDGSGGSFTNHRNVIFGSETVPTIPLDSDTYDTTTKLFHGLRDRCTGDCAALVIPHNTNESKGMSLDLPDTIATAELALIHNYQRLVEIYQHKGDSECFHDPGAGSDDGCGFEYVNPGDPADTKLSYVRTALGNGIAYAANHASANPLELGIIASTDDHNGIAGLVAEDQYAGHLGILDASAKLRLTNSPQFGPGGLAGVWAEQNTREAVYASLQARETFGTSGPRIRVRMYETTAANACTNFPAAIIDADNAIAMGGTFHAAQTVNHRATFAIEAWPDPAKQPVVEGTPRAAMFAAAEMVKVRTVTSNGVKQTVEAVIPVAGLPASGGCTTWSDPDLDKLGADDQVVYYLRVRQEPTLRWSHFDCLKEPTNAACSDKANTDPIQERAWTSPIWYVP